MKCGQDKARASLYVSDLLTRAERAEYERHIAECEECRAEVGRYRRMAEMLRGLPRAEAPAELSEYVMRRLAAEDAPAPKAKRVAFFRLPVFQAAAAALMLAVGVGLVFYAHNLPQDAGTKIAEQIEKEPVSPVKEDAAEVSAGAPSCGDAAAGVRGESMLAAAMPGSVDPQAYYANIAGVDRALEGMSADELRELATKNHDTLANFALAQSDPAFRRTLEASPGDREVFTQMTQKRVILNALNRTGNLEKAALIIKEIAPIHDAPAKDKMSFKALESEIGGAAPGREAEPEAGEGPGNDRETRKEATADTAKAAPKNELTPSEEVGRFSRSLKLRGGDEEVKTVTLVFAQELTLAPGAASGEKAGLDRAMKSDLKLVFDNLPTLENYRVEDFPKTGLTVRLTEEEFLRLLKYLRDVGNIRVALGPMLPKLEAGPAEAATTEEGGAKKMPEVADPYAVDVKIRVLDE